ncbi:DUF937 domain-containing protein [Aestuariivirga sp.]|uniref:DUF937 domain-containing protein n=1 Tax=Aestuariivirga sp. TaxID=2650926 RepID=UPI003784E9E6
MALNIVSAIINSLAPSVVDKVAAALGVNSGLARTALSAAVPAVLAIFGSKASTDTGARALFDAVSKTDTGAFGDLAATLSGAKGEKFLQGGLGSLGSLLGDTGLKSLTNAIGRQAGIGSDASSSIVSLAGQLAMGQLAKSAASEGLDAAGLGNMLRGQQNNIKSALPAGLGDMLSASGLVGSNFAEQAGRAATNAVHHTAQVTKKGTNWLTWALPVLLALVALWWFLGNRSATTVTEAVPQAVKEVMVDGVDVGKQLTGTLDGLRTTLGGITDAATAEAALPKLQETVTAFDGISGLAAKLTAEQRSMLAGLVSVALPAIKEVSGKVLAIPGVGSILKTTVDGLVAKIEALAKPA